MKEVSGFKLEETCNLFRGILKCDLIRFIIPALNASNANNSQNVVQSAEEKIVLDMLEIDVLKGVADKRCVDTNNLKLINIGAVAFFSEHRSSTSNG